MDLHLHLGVHGGDVTFDLGGHRGRRVGAGDHREQFSAIGQQAIEEGEGRPHHVGGDRGDALAAGDADPVTLGDLADVASRGADGSGDLAGGDRCDRLDHLGGVLVGIGRRAPRASRPSARRRRCVR